MEDVMALSTIDPEFNECLKQGGPPPKLHGDVVEMRATLSANKRNLKDTLSNEEQDVVVEEMHAPARDGYKLPLRVYKAKSPSGPQRPLFVAFHGGGWVLGDLDSEEFNCRLFAQKFNGIVVNVDYRLAPEHRFPAAPNDAWDAVQWAAANATKLGAQPDAGFIVFGVSAGGNLTDVVGHLARDHKLEPPLTGLLELIPAVLPPEVVPDKYKAEYLSSEFNKTAPILDSETRAWFRGHYQPDVDSHLYAPFNHPDGHAGLPPIAFQVCGLDPLRDEALIYERVLREDFGVKTKLHVYPGLPHGFWSFYPHLKSSQQFVKDTVHCVEWLLEHTQTK